MDNLLNLFDGYNKQAIIKELKNIKTEIKEKSYSIINIDGDFFDLCYSIVDLEDIYGVIDKHISELKGE